MYVCAPGYIRVITQNIDINKLRSTMYMVPVLYRSSPILWYSVDWWDSVVLPPRHPGD